MRESSGVAAGLASLPSGGGGIAPLGERFQPDLVRGSGSYAVPLSLPRGPNEQRPDLSLTYSTGSGNGPFGLGWRLNTLRIERRTDRGIPGYTDDDTFMIGDAELLVPVGGGRYRPRTDTKFWLIERGPAGVPDGWRIRTGDGATMLFGQSEASREADGARVFAWYLDEQRDAAGNSIRFSYRRDGGRLYLDAIDYSIFSVRVRYEARPDVLRSGRAGWERATALRANAIELHCARLQPTLMRTYTLAYTEAANGASLLQRVELSGTADGQTVSFPPLTFAYSGLDFTNWQVHELLSPIPPPSLDDRATQLVDMTGDGLPDVLQSNGSRTLLWRNRGGRFEGPSALDGVPALLALDRENVAFADLDGNGRVDLFAVDQPLQLVFESTGKGGFAAKPVVFQSRPNLRLAAGDTRLMDIDGDGVTDLIATGHDNLLLYRHRPGAGWEEPFAVERVRDLARFPDVAFGDRGVRLADMSGDGLQDVVAVQSGDVAYWPYFGNGVWGKRVPMQNAPVFPPGYRDDRVYLVDLDGDGCSDVVYMDGERTLIWLNQAGGGFAAPVELPVAPAGNARVQVVDCFGDGRPGFAWSAPASVPDSAGCRFLRFDAGQAPYLLQTIDNGMGGRYEMSYATSTQMRLQDAAEGVDWPGELPFAAHVVETIRERDTVTGRVTEMRMRYHDGVYDGVQREFRGFTRVTVDEPGDASTPALRQAVEFFQGDPEHPDLVERERERALAGTMQTLRLFERLDGRDELRRETRQSWAVRLEHDGPAGRVFFPFMGQIEVREHSPTAAPRRVERTTLLDYDAHGNAGRRVREYFAEGDAPDKIIRTEERFSYTTDEVNWLVKLPVRLEMRDGAGVPCAARVNFYDGTPFEGLPEGQAAAGLLARTLELALLPAQLPAGYIGGRDFAALGYTAGGAGDTQGFYRTTFAVRRDARGNVVEQRDPLGASLGVVFDADGVFPSSTRDALGRETTFTFEPRSGEPARTVLPDGRVLRSDYDAIGRLIANFEVDDAGAEQLVTCWQADIAAVPTSVTSFAPRAAGRTRAELTAADAASLVDVMVTRVYYDGFGKQALQVATAPETPAGERRFVTSQQTRVNPRQQVTAEFAPAFTPALAFAPAPAADAASVRKRYDVEGNLVEAAGPGPAHFRIARDNFTLRHWEGAAAGDFGAPAPAAPPTRVEHFDARDRVARIDEARGDGAMVVTGYRLTVDGRIEVIEDGAGGEITRYVFACAAEPIRITHRDAGTRTYYRDAAGRLVEMVAADGARLFYSYDPAGRLARVEQAGADGANRQVVREIVYDADPSAPADGRFLMGRIAVAREGDAVIRYAYNRAGRVVREEVTTAGATLATGFEYDLQGRLSAVIYPDNRRVDYTLDASGAVQRIPGVVTRVSYAASGAMDGYTLANGVDIALPQDAVSRRLTEVSARLGPAALRRIVYSYDAIGNITALRDETPGGVEQHSFTYDGLYRLASFHVGAGDAAGATLREGVYSYDDEGNLQRFGDTAPLTLRYADAARRGRLTAVAGAAGAAPISYDDRGAISAFGELTAIDFDAFDRVARVAKADGTETRFGYDAQGRRLLKEVVAGGATRRVRYAGAYFEQHATQALRHVMLANRLVATEKVAPADGATEVAYYLSDHHGTILLATDAAGAIIANQGYSPFGQALDPDAALDRYLGRERDAETGLLHLGLRYYAPALGRFISPDWYVLENPTKPMRMPQGFNVYSYGLNNPLVFKDPSGLWFGIDDLIVAAVGFVVGFATGLIYGLANGQGWGSLLTALETGFTTGAGAWLGWNTGMLVGGPALALFGAVMGGMNGLLTGTRGIYDWQSIEGWAAFVSDSTWGLLGATLGNIANINNLIAAPSSYRSDLSRRQNRQVYDRGLYLEKNAAFTQGNTISNLQGRTNLLSHETVHILQGRLFGPVFQITYVAWVVVGGLIGLILAPFIDQNWKTSVRDIAYSDNPWERWGYALGGKDTGAGKLAW